MKKTNLIKMFLLLSYTCVAIASPSTDSAASTLSAAINSEELKAGLNYGAQIFVAAAATGLAISFYKKESYLNFLSSHIGIMTKVAISVPVWKMVAGLLAQQHELAPLVLFPLVLLS